MNLIKGETYTIWFEQNGIEYWAVCEYKGRRKGRYIFESVTYGWKYYIYESGEVVHENRPDEIMKLEKITA
jgi:hypothetical protein